MFNFILTAFQIVTTKTVDIDILFIDCILLFSGLQLHGKEETHSRVLKETLPSTTGSHA